MPVTPVVPVEPWRDPLKPEPTSPTLETSEKPLPCFEITDLHERRFCLKKKGPRYCHTLHGWQKTECIKAFAEENVKVTRLLGITGAVMLVLLLVALYWRYVTRDLGPADDEEEAESRMQTALPNDPEKTSYKKQEAGVVGQVGLGRGLGSVVLDGRADKRLVKEKKHVGFTGLDGSSELIASSWRVPGSVEKGNQIWQRLRETGQVVYQSSSKTPKNLHPRPSPMPLAPRIPEPVLPKPTISFNNGISQFLGLQRSEREFYNHRPPPTPMMAPQVSELVLPKPTISFNDTQRFRLGLTRKPVPSSQKDGVPMGGPIMESLVPSIRITRPTSSSESAFKASCPGGFE